MTTAHDLNEVMMAITLSTAHGEQLAHLRIEPTVKRVRARLGDETVLDSRRAVLVWEPHRVVPTYAVPLDDIGGAVTASSTDPPPTPERPRSEWDPRVPFSVRLTPGRSVVISGAQDDAADGFIADDPDLDGYVILDFSGFTTWLEDEDTIISHPHDPYARIDIRQSSLHLEYRHGGVPLVDTTRAKALYETYLPVRYYVPAEDVVVPLEPSDTITFCSYKGRATYYSPVVAGTPMRDLAWSYTDPLVDALEVKDHIAFFDEKLDLTIDGVARPRPITPWS